MSGRIWFEVWPASLGFYHVKRYGDSFLGVPMGPFTVATVFGRKRAVAKARALQVPVFSTLTDRGGEAAREAPPNDLRESTKEGETPDG